MFDFEIDTKQEIIGFEFDLSKPLNLIKGTGQGPYKGYVTDSETSVALLFQETHYVDHANKTFSNTSHLNFQKLASAKFEPLMFAY